MPEIDEIVEEICLKMQDNRPTTKQRIRQVVIQFYYRKESLKKKLEEWVIFIMAEMI